jgi:putative phage-type endonuclease
MNATAVCHESSDLWKVERANGLGGSDAPQILGISPFGGPASVAASKLGFYAGDVESELHEWGHYVEEPLIRRFAAETGIEGKLSGVLYRSNDAATPWLQATLDGDIPGENAGIQCKLAVFSWDAWDEGVPDYVEAQVQHEMAVTGWDAVYVLALLRGYQFRWSRVERDEAFIAERLVPTLGEFWRKLKADEPIAPLGAPDREWEALKLRYARPVEGKVVHLAGADWVEEFERWRDFSRTKSSAEKAAKESRNRLVAAIGDGEIATLDDGTRLTLKRQTRASYVVEESTFPVLRESKR